MNTNGWRSALSIVILALVLGAGPAAIAVAAPGYAGGQVLTDQSSLEIGCFGPCACPIQIIGPAKGTFRITEVDPDPLYRHFLVTHVDWTIDESQWGWPSKRLTGSGSYRVGGEVALQHQLVLDLSIDGDPPLRFDSGLVPGGGEFPAIDIEVSRHGFACYDTAFHLVSRPGVAGVDDDGRTMRLSISPNPFVGRAGLRFVTATAGRVDAGIYDLTGRRVRALVDGVVLAAGPHELEWDGVGDSGSRVASGLYFVRVRAGGRESRTTIVLLR